MASWFFPRVKFQGKAGTASVTLLRVRAPTSIWYLHLLMPVRHHDGDEVEGRSACDLDVTGPWSFEKPGAIRMAYDLSDQASSGTSGTSGTTSCMDQRK